METRSGDRGQVVPLVLAVMVVAVVLALALIPLGRASQQRAAAQTAADAAALAGAAEGEALARQVAAANGGRLLHWHAAGLEVWVEVEVGEATARAKARRG